MSHLESRQPQSIFQTYDNRKPYANGGSSRMTPLEMSYRKKSTPEIFFPRSPKAAVSNRRTLFQSKKGSVPSLGQHASYQQPFLKSMQGSHSSSRNKNSTVVVNEKTVIIDLRNKVDKKRTEKKVLASKNTEIEELKQENKELWKRILAQNK